MKKTEIRELYNILQIYLFSILNIDFLYDFFKMQVFVTDPDQNVLPTMGFRMVSLKHKSYIVKIYDIGGSSQIRALWPKYYNDVSNMYIYCIL